MALRDALKHAVQDRVDADFIAAMEGLVKSHVSSALGVNFADVQCDLSNRSSHSGDEWIEVHVFVPVWGDAVKHSARITADVFKLPDTQKVVHGAIIAEHGAVQATLPPDMEPWLEPPAPSISCPKCRRPARLVHGDAGRPGAVYECNADGAGGCGCVTVDCAGCGEVYTVRDATGRGDDMGSPPVCPECGVSVEW